MRANIDCCLCLKAFTPIVTMLALFVAGLETPTMRLLTALALVTFGTALASLGEVNLSIMGMAFMLASEVFEAVRLVMTQILLVELEFHPSEYCVHSDLGRGGEVVHLGLGHLVVGRLAE